MDCFFGLGLRFRLGAVVFSFPQPDRLWSHLHGGGAAFRLVFEPFGLPDVLPAFVGPALQAVGAGPVQILEAIRVIDPKIRFYQASSSEMFGRARTAPQDQPRNVTGPPGPPRRTLARPDT